MHAYLLITDNATEAKKRAYEVIPKEVRFIPFGVAKVADARELARLAAISASEKTAYFLENFDSASVEAQSTLLKTLEEAQENIVYVLTAKSEEAVLPTIVSRCQVVRVKGKRVKDERNIVIDFAAISKITKRQEAKEYLESAVESLHRKLPEKLELAQTAKLANETLKRINANANPTLQLTNFILQI
jgi:DNA polymerase III delta prime subunit